ncbi:MAG: hypothetical protein Q4D98_05120 [Planctomycetia bacterium]|nr:hypothetical protein [Planctomycetia bacterium]
MKYSISNQRRGLTLVELLVVAGLMVLLISVSIPVLNPMGEGRLARETVRGVQQALETARMRAIRLGRPCGVTLNLFDKDNRISFVMDQVTAPPNVETTCTVSESGISSIEWLPIPLKVGDRIQLNHSGPWFRYTGSGWNYGDYRLYTASNVDCTIRYAPVPESASAFSKVLGIDPSYTLPKGMVIDLYYSGNTLGGTWGTPTSPPTILFHPDGTVSLNRNGSDVSLYSADSRIYLLIGRWDRGLQAAEDGQHNTQDPNAFWVVIAPRTGMVTSVVNNAFSGNSVIGATDVSTARDNANDSANSEGG